MTGPSDAFSQKLRSLRVDVRENESMASHTTVRVGGPARWMVFPRDETQLARILEPIVAEGVERTLIGRGANLFADSDGYRGVVINMTRWKAGFAIDADGLLVAGGGANLRNIALEAARLGWCGIDFMAVVPGTVGAAVAINAGTNVEGYVADRAESVETLTYGGEKRRYRADEMEFGYRRSRLLYGREIVTRAAFRLLSCADTGTTPDDVLARFDAAMRLREVKFPLDLPNFGSTFRSPDAPHPPVGKLIDELGMKGLRIGAAQISPMHGNFIVNLGDATSGDILAVMQRMHDAVLERWGVALRPEVHYLCNCGRPRPEFFAPIS